MNLTAVYLPGRGVQLDVTGATNSTTVPTLVRLDANGRKPVRLPFTNLGGGAWRVRDREHALLGPVRYVVSGPGTDGYAETTGLPATFAPTLSAPLNNLRDVELLQVSGLSGDRETGATVHTIPGRAQPIVTADVLSTRRGTMQLLVGDYATAQDVLALVTATQVLHLRQVDHPGLDLYFTTTGYSEAHAGATYWQVTLTYVELIDPAGPGVETGVWTFDGVTASASRFDDLRKTWWTFDELEKGA